MDKKSKAASHGAVMYLGPPTLIVGLAFGNGLHCGQVNSVSWLRAAPFEIEKASFGSKRVLGGTNRERAGGMLLCAGQGYSDARRKKLAPGTSSPSSP